MDTTVCSPAGLAWWCQAIRHRRTSLMSGGLCRQSPRDPLVRLCDHGSCDLLFAFTELRTYPTSCSLQNGRVGFIASLLLAVLTHRLRMRRFPPIGYRGHGVLHLADAACSSSTWVQLPSGQARDSARRNRNHYRCFPNLHLLAIRGIGKGPGD